MNIAVLTTRGKVIIRPDTTRVKDAEDSYLPEFVNRVDWTPVVFAKVIKSGRSVGRQFASRYLGPVSAGVLLYPVDLMDGSEEGYACASCLDHTSILNLESVSGTESSPIREIEVVKDGKSIFHSGQDFTSLLLDAISEITRFCWLRVGDLIAIELDIRKEICSRGYDSPEIMIRADKKEISVFKVVL